MKSTWVKIGLIGVLLTVLSIVGAFVLWEWEEPTSINMAIINKTVRDDSYKEHHGLMWVLNSEKYVNQNNETYNLAEDYYGPIPDESDGQLEVRTLPEELDEIDFIYIADTYGIYEDDFEGEGVHQEHSELIYGGLEREEWERIQQRLSEDNPSSLIVEFNTLASPTEEDLANEVSQYLGIERTGWVGRYFEELDPSVTEEIANWKVEQYEETQEWTYSGPGFVLINEAEDELVILEEGEDVTEDGIHIQFTEIGEERFGLSESLAYMQWFDIVEATDEDAVVANYEWSLMETGEEKLDKHHVPKQFAAITHVERNQTESYYFAGDFSDVSSLPHFHNYVGVNWLWSNVPRSHFSEQNFFWDTYVPLMKTILAEHTEKEPQEVEAIETEMVDNLHYTARLNDQNYEVLIDGEWQEIPIKGVNMGMAKPGTFPGEAGITQEEYRRWFQMITDMGANTIRVYTLHPPGFYQALRDHNQQSEEKLYVFHGVWIEEEPLEETLDAFHQETNEAFQTEMKTIVDAIHGNAEVEENPGHAHGTYRADISPYVIGWIIGIEWYPHTVVHTNEEYSDIGEYQGDFVETEGAEAFEYWLAEQFDYLLSYEAEVYDWIRPISFTNWVTTDLLDHPSEPSEEEDLVGVDPNVIYMKEEAETTNQFASYHVYPYYPDFFNYDEEYLEFEDHRGENNSYAAYLKDLHEAHRIPVLVAEFGIPASRGMTHENPFGKNQGFIEESEQGEIVVGLFEDIMEEDMLGGLIFTWQDEWFKRTWNTMDYDDPNRRPYWSNAQTNEQFFGLLSFDRLKIKINGDSTDWEESTLLYEEENNEYLESVWADHDERYLYLRIDVNAQAAGENLFSNGFPVILFDTKEDSGSTSMNELTDLSYENGLNFVTWMEDWEESRMLVDARYDFFTHQYYWEHSMLDELGFSESEIEGTFLPIHYALNQELLIPSTGEVIPFSYYETGKLRHGNGDPESEEYDSLADFYVDEESGMIEMRIPWMLLQFKDPSQRQVMSDVYDGDGGQSMEAIDGIHISVLYVNETEEEGYQMLESFPQREEEEIKLSEVMMYEWETWDEPLYEERLKESYSVIQEAFNQIE